MQCFFYSIVLPVCDGSFISKPYLTYTGRNFFIEKPVGFLTYKPMLTLFENG